MKEKNSMWWSLLQFVLISSIIGTSVGVELTIKLPFGGKSLSTSNASKNCTFPSDFRFGAASSSYQIEGGWKKGGKSKSIWDTTLHNDPSFTADGLNADVAADSYNLYQKDIDALKNVGVSQG